MRRQLASYGFYCAVIAVFLLAIVGVERLLGHGGPPALHPAGEAGDAAQAPEGWPAGQAPASPRGSQAPAREEVPAGREYGGGESRGSTGGPVATEAPVGAGAGVGAGTESSAGTRDAGPVAPASPGAGAGTGGGAAAVEDAHEAPPAAMPRLLVTVRDGRTLQPVREPRATLAVHGASGPPLVVSPYDTGFLLDGVGPGAYDLVVSADGYLDARVPIILEARTAATLVVDLFRLPHIAGTVVDSRGIAIPGAFIYVDENHEHRDIPSALRGRLGAGTFAETDDHGDFRLTPAVAGRLVLRAFHPAHPAVDVSVDAPPGGEVGGLVVTLADGGRIAGTAVGVGGAPLDGARVRVEGTGVTRATTAASDGSFEIAGLAAGGYRASLIDADERTVASLEIALADGESREIVLRAEPEIAVTGLVTWRGQPVGSVHITLAETGSITRSPYLDAASGDDGRYRIERVWPGTYDVYVETYDVHVENARVLVGVEVGGTAPEVVLDIPLAGATIEGVVTDRSTGLPPDEAQIILFADPPPPGDRLLGYILDRPIDPGGAYLIEGLAPGSYRVTAMAPGYAEEEDRLVAGLAGSTRIDFSLGRGGSISGTAYGPDGEPAAHASLWMERLPEGTPVVNSVFQTTDMDGRYGVGGLPAGSYRVAASLPGIGIRTEMVDLAGEDLVRDLRIAAGATLDLTAATLDGTPIPGVDVTLRHLEGQLPRNPLSVALGMEDAADGVTDALGRFVRSALPPGPYEVSLARPGAEPTTIRVSLDPGGTVRQSVPLWP